MNVLLLALFLAAPASAPADTVAVTRLRYDGGGDWYANPSSLPNLLTAIRERTGIPVSSREATVSLLDPSLFYGCAPGFRPLKPLLDAALAAGRLTAQRHAGAWRDVGTPARLAELDAELRLGKARHPVLSSPVG